MIQKFIKRIQEFGRTQITPHRKQWDKVQALPTQFFKQLGKLGIMGSLVPKKYGGLGSNYTQYATVIEEFAKLDSAVARSLIAHNSLCLGDILDYGNNTQQQMWLHRLASGKCIGSWALTEPEAGSDVRDLTTIARKVDGGGVLNGKKHSIINGPISNLVIVTAKTKVEHHKENMSAFVVEKGNPGMHVGRKDDKMGIRAVETAELLFEDCYVSSENVLEKIGQGLQQVMHVLGGGIIAMDALSRGIAKGDLAIAVKHAQKRCQFKQPIIPFQGVFFPLAELAVAATNIAMQILGGYGYMRRMHTENLYRDAKLCTIVEGTSKIQKTIIAKVLQRENAWEDPYLKAVPYVR